MEYIEDNIIKWDAMNCCILASDYLYPLFQIKNGTDCLKLLDAR